MTSARRQTAVRRAVRSIVLLCCAATLLCLVLLGLGYGALLLFVYHASPY
ncbi:hypothetical protein [Nocardia sp. NPDC050435]